MRKTGGIPMRLCEDVQLCQAIPVRELFVAVHRRQPVPILHAARVSYIQLVDVRAADRGHRHARRFGELQQLPHILLLSASVRHKPEHLAFTVISATEVLFSFPAASKSRSLENHRDTLSKAR